MANRLQVLLVEDVADDAELLEIELIRGGLDPELFRVETREAFADALRARPWDVIVSDYQLPSFGADDALTTLLASGKDIPFIIVSGAVQVEDAIQLLKRGADDFLNKGALARLVPAIERALRDAAERAQRRSYEELLLRQANFDDLTGLPNRVLMRDRLNQAIAIARRNRSRTALLFIDLDRFKYVNDLLGHSTGDRMILEAAQRFAGCIRGGDTLARMGGDEFVVILPDIVDGNCVRQVAERLLESAARPYRLDGHDLFVTASIGITLFPDDADEGAMLLRNADLAMYKAKELGRNGYHFFTQEIDQRMQSRLAIEARLRSALERDQFQLHYQPIVDLADGRPCALEALLRWRDENGNLCMPAEFIPIAEETGAIRAIGAWVVETACGEIRRLLDAASPYRRIAVNVSSHQLRAAGFAPFVIGQLERHGLAPDALELEITESVLLDASADTEANLKQLCDHGLRLSVDDFGTGYSALGYLQRYPFHTLKIDRIFVAAALCNPKTARLVEAIIAMGHGLGMEVVAEGVETEEQSAFLRQLRCNFAQGYLFGRPAPIETLS